MKNKILISSLLSFCTCFLFASEKIAIPLPAESLSIENSGLKQPIDAYQDGIGIYTMEALGANKVDNSEMNALVFKYGDAAKELNISVKEYVQTNGTNSEKELASTVGKFEPMIPGNGTVCNDNNAQTINDKYVNGVCTGTQFVAKTCLDILNAGLSVGDGIYTIDPDGDGAINSFQAYCDMTTDGGGWTLVTSWKYKNINNAFYNSQSVSLNGDNSYVAGKDYRLPINIWKLLNTSNKWFTKINSNTYAIVSGVDLTTFSGNGVRFPTVGKVNGYTIPSSSYWWQNSGFSMTLDTYGSSIPNSIYSEDTFGLYASCNTSYCGTNMITQWFAR